MKKLSMKKAVGLIALGVLTISALTMNVVFGVTPIQGPDNSQYVGPTFQKATINTDLTVKNTLEAKKANLENADIGALRVDSLGSAIDTIVRVIENLKVTGYIESTGDALVGGILKVGTDSFVANSNGTTTITSSADISRAAKTGPLVIKSTVGGIVTSWMGFLGNTIYSSGNLYLYPSDPNRLVYVGDGNDANKYHLKVSGTATVGDRLFVNGDATVDNQLTVKGVADLQGQTNAKNLSVSGLTTLNNTDIVGKVTGSLNKWVEFADHAMFDKYIYVHDISSGPAAGANNPNPLRIQDAMRVYGYLELWGKLKNGTPTDSDPVAVDDNLSVTGNISANGQYKGGLALANFKKTTDSRKTVLKGDVSTFFAECPAGYFAVSCNYGADSGLVLNSMEVMNGVNVLGKTTNACYIAVKNPTAASLDYHYSANCVKGQ